MQADLLGTENRTITSIYYGDTRLGISLNYYDKKAVETKVSMRFMQQLDP